MAFSFVKQQRTHNRYGHEIGQKTPGKRTRTESARRDVSLDTLALRIAADMAPDFVMPGDEPEGV